MGTGPAHMRGTVAGRDPRKKDVRQSEAAADAIAEAKVETSL
jgi:hypothetical protein